MNLNIIRINSSSDTKFVSLLEFTLHKKKLYLYFQGKFSGQDPFNSASRNFGAFSIARLLTLNN